MKSDDDDPRDVVRAGVPVSANRSQYYVSHVGDPFLERYHVVKLTQDVWCLLMQNQPQAVQLKNGSWLLALTNAPFTEGDPRQRVVSMLHPSPDLTKPGWQPPVEIEGPGHGDNASAGWVVPLLAPELNRVYAFYTL